MTDLIARIESADGPDQDWSAIRDIIVDGLRRQGWSRIDAETEAEDRVADAQVKEAAALRAQEKDTNA